MLLSRLERWCRKLWLSLTLAVGDFCEGGSSSESLSGAREVLSSEIRFAWSQSPQGRMRLPRRRRQLREKRCTVGAGPEGRDVPGCWYGAGSCAGDVLGESRMAAAVAWKPQPWWHVGPQQNGAVMFGEGEGGGSPARRLSLTPPGRRWEVAPGLSRRVLLPPPLGTALWRNGALVFLRVTLVWCARDTLAEVGGAGSRQGPGVL